MSYDIWAWKLKKRSSLTAGAAFLCLGENVPCDEFAKLPTKRVTAALGDAWGDAELPAEWEVYGHYVCICIPWSRVEDVAPRASAALSEVGLTVYNPQNSSPTPQDEEYVAVLRAMAEEETGVDQEQIATWQRDANTGDPVAMNELGNCYSSGEGVERDPAAAVAWYRKAADLSHIPAELNLIQCYLEGDGVTLDHAEARARYEQLLSREQCVSAFALGEMYAQGIGGPTLRDRAIEMFTLARKNRHPEAYVALKALGAAHED